MLWRVFAIRSAKRAAQERADPLHVPQQTCLNLSGCDPIPYGIRSESQVHWATPATVLLWQPHVRVNQLEISCILFARLPSYVTNAQKPRSDRRDAMSSLPSMSDAKLHPALHGRALHVSTSRPAAPSARGADNNESELIRRVKEGDVEAFHNLVRPYERAIFLAALSLVRNEADAEDVAQEAILKAFKNLSSFRQEAKFSTWVIQIAINEAKMKLRKDRRHLYESLDEGQQNDEGDYVPKDFAEWREIPLEALEQSELRRALVKALDSLPEKYRTVLILRDVQQLSINETAQVLGLSDANVKTRLCRARLQMRDALAPGFDGAWSRGREYEKVRAF
jgi:RNA polymerase sigma-70 factor, ECF subfamily